MMTKLTATTSFLREYFPGYDSRFISGGCLLTPRHSKIFPPGRYVIDRELILDRDGNVINGIVPIDLTAKQHAEIADAIISDLSGANLDLKSNLRNILFLQPVPDQGDHTFRVVEPCQATHFYLITSWHHDRGQGGVSKRYAHDHSFVCFQKHKPKSNKSGRDFMVLPARTLSDSTLSYFEQLWQNAAAGR